ncbi:unnamed protein product [Chrysoparadoxa australica]
MQCLRSVRGLRKHAKAISCGCWGSRNASATSANNDHMFLQRPKKMPRWVAADPDEDLSVITWDAARKDIPEGVNFGVISDASKEMIYNLNKDDPVKNSFAALASRFKMKKSRVQMICKLKELQREEETEGIEMFPDADDELRTQQMEVAAVVADEYQVPVETIWKEAPDDFGDIVDRKLRILPEDKKIGHWLPRDDTAQEVEEEEHRISVNEQRRRARYESAKATLTEQLMQNVTVFPPKRWDYVMKDTSLPGGPSVVRDRTGVLRFATAEEEKKLSWRKDKA